MKLLRLSNEKANQIAADPMIYKTADFQNMRVATMGHYSLIYKITDDTIIITAFWDNRQDPGKLLKLLEAQSGKGI